MPEKLGGFQRIRDIPIPGIHPAVQDALLLPVAEDADSLHEKLRPVHPGIADLLHFIRHIGDLAVLTCQIFLQQSQVFILGNRNGCQGDTACTDGDGIPRWVQVIGSFIHTQIPPVNPMGRGIALHILPGPDGADIGPGVRLIHNV